MSVQTLSQLSGVPASVIYDIERGDQDTTGRMAVIAEILGVRGKWLMDDVGPMEVAAEGHDLDAEHVVVGRTPDSGAMLFVDRIVGASLSAGSGEVIWDFDQEEKSHAFRRDWMVKKGLRAERCKVWAVRGESMEPRYSAGDALLIDMSDRTPKHGKRFALVGDDGLRVKQLHQTPTGWVMHSLNPDKTKYPDEPIVNENFAIIGRVRGRAGDED
jgi:phage repressor protein C with HTH and peptisase S24 domain